MKQIDGKAAFLVDPSCATLIRGFKYAYRWRENRKGDLEGLEPEKNSVSHVHDGLQYGALVVSVGVLGTRLKPKGARTITQVSANGWT